MDMVSEKIYSRIISYWLRLNHPVSFVLPSAMAKPSSSQPSSKATSHKSSVCTGNFYTKCNLCV